MHDTVAVAAPRRKFTLAAACACVPKLAEVSLVIASALLLILSFPDFELWPLAWVGLVPFLVVAGRPLHAGRALLLGWLWGAIFFYGTCWWLTYPMIHYAHISAWVAYPLLLAPIALVAVFPALFSLLLSRLVDRFGPRAILTAPLLWVSFEWARYAVTDQLWNAVGYSQAFHPWLIQSARWGGVYAVSFLIVTANVALALAVNVPPASVAVMVRVPTVLKVKLAKVRVPATRVMFPAVPPLSSGMVALESELVIVTFVVAVLTTFQLASTALTTIPLAIAVPAV